MKELLIKSYIKSLTKDDIKMYAKKNDIILSNTELEYIFFNIKNNYEKILSNPELYLKKFKTDLNTSTYQKIYELYTIYYPKLYH